MSRAFAKVFGPVAAAWFCLHPAWGQSLEDKVAQAQQMQAQSMSGADLSGMSPTVVDSVLQARQAAKAQGTANSFSPAARTQNLMLDSLLSGPQQSDTSTFGLANDTDTLIVDSTGRRRLVHKPPPKRYEQRIFQSVNRSAFANAVGAVGRDYVLGPGDAVTLFMWGDKEKEYNLVLDSQGAVFLEGVGIVPISGMTVDQAEKELRERLSRIYSGIKRGTMNISLTVGQPGPKKIFVLGDVKVPGGYVFTGHTSVLSVMYYAQGPTDIGTVRNIILNRSGKQYKLDLYDYLMRGEIPKPDVLQDGDVIFVGRAQLLVDIAGDVGRPATYEMKKGEGIKDLLAYAGGLNPTAARQTMTLQRIFPDGRVDYINLPPPQDFLSGKAEFELHDGDKLLVDKSTEPTHDFYTISGPVKYPGTYESDDITSVQVLIQKAGGLREDAFLGRIHVVRFHPDGSSELFAYSADKTSPDSIVLKPKDEVILYSVKDMYLPDSVQIAGAVFHPGKFEFRQGMTVKDLVMEAGGFLPEHEAGKALVFRGDSHERRVKQIDVSMQPGLDKSPENIELQPYDVVQIPVDPRWYRKEVVTLNGLFLHPGDYALLHPDEKLASVIERAGGFKPDAYVEGARFFRHKDSVGRVGIDVEEAVRHRDSKQNITLMGGDSLFIPERSNTVKVIGEVGFETSVLYREGASVGYYIDKAGGFTRRSEKDRVVVQYANGETSTEGIFNRKPDAGSVIYVPQGPEPKQIDWFAGINAILGTVGIVVALILSIQAIKKG